MANFENTSPTEYALVKYFAFSTKLFGLLEENKTKQYYYQCLVCHQALRTFSWRITPEDYRLATAFVLCQIRGNEARDSVEE